MMRYLMIGILLFAVFAVSFAPAGLLTRGLSNAPVDLLDPRGTVWQGQGQLHAQTSPLGQLNWSFQPTSLLRAHPSYDWTLDHSQWQLAGVSGVDFNSASLYAHGKANAQAFNAWLDAYDIQISGSIDLQPTAVRVDHNNLQVTELQGQADWSGGLVHYTLAGVLKESRLPPLTAIMTLNAQQLPEAVVYAQGQQTPLIIATLQKDGFAKVAITKLFTKLVGSPYPGSDPDHEVVIVVEEKVI